MQRHAVCGVPSGGREGGPYAFPADHGADFPKAFLWGNQAVHQATTEAIEVYRGYAKRAENTAAIPPKGPQLAANPLRKKGIPGRAGTSVGPVWGRKDMNDRYYSTTIRSLCHLILCFQHNTMCRVPTQSRDRAVSYCGTKRVSGQAEGMTKE